MTTGKKIDELNQEYTELIDELKKELESSDDYQVSHKVLEIHDQLLKKHQTITDLMPTINPNE